ncbi:MAG: flagellar protein FliT [Solirubrobacteraceae bacterium]|nr:flagellar protein FliT [Solirubrobacteraceae bacterium]
MSDGGAAAARRVVEIAREEQELIAAGRVEELDALHQRRQAAMAALPPAEELSEAAREALREALDLQARISESLQVAMALHRAELGRLSHGRTAIAGYSPAGLDARPVLDRTA